MKSKVTNILLKRVVPVVATATMASALYGNATFASTNTINAELGDTLTIGAGYYEEDTIIVVPSLESQTNGTAKEQDILDGKTAWVNGSQLTGTMANYGKSVGQDSTFEETDAKLYVKPVNTGYYTSGSSFDTGILYDPKGSATSYTAESNGALLSTTGNDIDLSAAVDLPAGQKLTIPSGYYSAPITVQNASITRGALTDAIVAAEDFASGYYTSNEVTKKVAETFTPGTTDQTILANQFLLGAQTIKGDTDLNAVNIKKDVDIFGVKGTFTAANTVSPGQTAATSNKILSKYSAWVDGKEVKGDIPIDQKGTSSVSDLSKGSAVNATTGNAITLAGATLNLDSSSKITIPSGYYSSDINVQNAVETKGALTNAIVAADEFDAGNYTSNAVTKKAAQTYTPGTSNQTIAANQFLLGAQTIKGDADLKAENIKTGIDIFGKVGTFTKASTVSTGQTAATAAQMLSGYSAWVDGVEVKGTIASKGALTNAIVANSTFASGYYTSNSVTKKAAQTYTPGTADQTIAANQFLTGAQTIKGDADLTVGNIKTGVDIFGKVGTFTKSGTQTTGQSVAAAAQLRKGYSAWVDGVEVKGAMTEKAAASYTPGTTDQTIAASQYLTGKQTIKGDADLAAANIKTGVDIFGVTGTYTKSGTQSSGQTVATAAQMLSGYSAWVDGVEVKGSIVSKGALTNAIVANSTFASGYYTSNSVTKKAAQTYTPGTADQTIAANQFLTGAQTIKGDADLAVGNIKSGVEIFGKTGTFTKDGTQTSGQTVATAAQIRKGYSAWVNGTEIKGNMTEKAAASYTPGTADQTIASGQLLTGAQTIKGDTDLAAANIKTGVDIFGVTGTYTKTGTQTSGQSVATTAQIRKGYSAWVNGAEVKGNMTEKAAATYTPGTADQTISSGQYLTGAQTIKGDADLKVANIKTGVEIFGVTGTFTSDATAGSGDLISGTTAYVKGSKVTGSIAKNPAGTAGTANTGVGTAISSSSGSSVTLNGSTLNLDSGAKITIPAGYYSSGITVQNGGEDPNAVYNRGYNAGVAAADGRANASSVNYQSGYNAGYSKGVSDADNRANSSSVNYQTGYNKGVADADSRTNTSSASYQAGYNAGVAAADGRTNTSSASYQSGYNAGKAASVPTLSNSSVSVLVVGGAGNGNKTYGYNGNTKVYEKTSLPLDEDISLNGMTAHVTCSYALSGGAKISITAKSSGLLYIAHENTTVGAFHELSAGQTLTWNIDSSNVETFLFYK